MNFKIRHYSPADGPMILGWWKASGEHPPLEEMMPPESSFVLSLGDKPILAVAVYLSNVKTVAWVENLIGCPDAKGDLRRKATRTMLAFLKQFAKERGYRRLFCMAGADKPDLEKYYQSLGFTATAKVTCFIQEV